MAPKYMQSYQPGKKNLMDELTGLCWAKKTEIIFNLIVTIVGTGLTILMIAWLFHQVQAIWNL